MPDVPDPPRKVYGFKDREFKRTNTPASASEHTPTAKELAMMSGPVTPTAPPTLSRARATDPNDVYALLHQNRSVEKRLGLDEIEIRKIRSRRWRDYLIMLVAGNALIVGLMGFGNINVISMLFAFGGVIVFSVSLTWIMWQVMDKY